MEMPLVLGERGFWFLGERSVFWLVPEEPEDDIDLTSNPKKRKKYIFLLKFMVLFFCLFIYSFVIIIAVAAVIVAPGFCQFLLLGCF